MILSDDYDQTRGDQVQIAKQSFQLKQCCRLYVVHANPLDHAPLRHSR